MLQGPLGETAASRHPCHTPHLRLQPQQPLTGAPALTDLTYQGQHQNSLEDTNPGPLPAERTLGCPGGTGQVTKCRSRFKNPAAFC